jgi:N-acyl-D-amino-acid deacylase
MFDLILRNGKVVDGSGLPWVRADVGINVDRIVAIGNLDKAVAQQTLDATGCVVSPGFVDAHVHGDLPMLVDPMQEAAVRQGVTTFINGQDGVAFAPASPNTMQYMKLYTAGFNGNFNTPGKSWSNITEYLDLITHQCAINAAVLIPNGNVRMEVMGLDERKPTSQELEKMLSLIREGMEQGAVGVSTGLDYIPSLYADVHELISLCKVMREYDGVYVSHIRGYSPERFDLGINEILEIAYHADCPVHVSHFNVLADYALPIIDRSRASGLDITYDLYPYLYGNTILAMVTLPTEYCAGGIAATVERLKRDDTRESLVPHFVKPRFPINTIQLSNVPNPSLSKYEGLALSQAIVAAKQRTPDIRDTIDFVCDLLIETNLAAGCIIRHFSQRQESDIRALMNHPAMMAGSDGIYCGGAPHPRGTGSFAKYLGEYVRNGTWSLETAVRHLAYHPARRHGLKDRGMIAKGYAADIAVFDPLQIQDRSSFTDGKALAVGMKHVLVNGVPILQDGERTPALPGRGLRRS